MNITSTIITASDGLQRDVRHVFYDRQFQRLLRRRKRAHEETQEGYAAARPAAGRRNVPHGLRCQEAQYALCRQKSGISRVVTGVQPHEPRAEREKAFRKNRMLPRP